MRHELLAAEMSLRGFKEKTPVMISSNEGVFNEGGWPEEYIDVPRAQFTLLAAKYEKKEQGRIPLPKNGQQVWSQHKYSVMARNVQLYKKIGRKVANTSSPDSADSADEFSVLVTLLTETLRTAPSPGGIRNALQHMWGYVSDHVPGSERNTEDWSLSKLLQSVQQGATKNQEPYLLASTALSELKIWIPKT